MENQTSSTKKIGMSYGLILGVTLALFTTLFYAFSIESLTKWWLGIIFFLVALVFGIVAVAKAKSTLNGFISFKEAFTTYFITIAIGLFINVVVGILIFNVVDPDAAIVLKESIIEASESMMARFGAPQEEIDKAVAKMQEEDSYGLGSQLQSYVFQLVFYSIFGLLVALIFKRKDPNVQ